MRNTRRTNSTETGLTDWFQAHADSKAAAAASMSKTRSSEITSYLNFLWPVSLEYFSPLPSIFLPELAQSPGLAGAHAPAYLVRDGLIPALWFFHVHPEPGRFKGRLYLHRRLESYVPPAWRSMVGSYEVESVVEPVGRLKGEPSRRGLLLTGVMMDTYCSVKHLEGLLERLPGSPGRRILAFLPGRFDGWGNEHRHEFHLDYLSVLHSKLGTKVKGLSWPELEGMTDLSGFEVIDLNEGHLWSDSYLMHLAMGRGAKPLSLSGEVDPAQLGTASTEWIALSPFHGLRIHSKVSAPYALGVSPKAIAGDAKAKYLIRFEKAMRSESNKRFPWPSWFGHWARRSQQEIEQSRHLGAGGRLPARTAIGRRPSSIKKKKARSSFDDLAP